MDWFQQVRTLSLEQQKVCNVMLEEGREYTADQLRWRLRVPRAFTGSVQARLRSLYRRCLLSRRMVGRNALWSVDRLVAAKIDAARLPAVATNLAAALKAGQDCAFALRDALLEAGLTDLAEHFAEERKHHARCWAIDKLTGGQPRGRRRRR
jgi:hypothetical protein